MFLGTLPNIKDISGAYRYLTVFIVSGKRIDKTHIQCQFSAVVGYAKHIVDVWVNAACTDGFGSLCQSLNHFLLYFRGFYDLCVEICLGNRQMEHICGLNISHHFEGGHQLR